MVGAQRLSGRRLNPEQSSNDPECAPIPSTRLSGEAEKKEEDKSRIEDKGEEEVKGEILEDSNESPTQV